MDSHAQPRSKLCLLSVGSWSLNFKHKPRGARFLTVLIGGLQRNPGLSPRVSAYLTMIFSPRCLRLGEADRKADARNYRPFVQGGGRKLRVSARCPGAYTLQVFRSPRNVGRSSGHVTDLRYYSANGERTTLLFIEPNCEERVQSDSLIMRESGIDCDSWLCDSLGA